MFRPHKHLPPPAAPAAHWFLQPLQELYKAAGQLLEQAEAHCLEAQ